MMMTESRKHRILTPEEKKLIPYWYFDVGMSSLEIAKKLGQHRTNITFYLKRHGYKARSLSEAQKTAVEEGRHFRYKGGRTNDGGYNVLLIKPEDPFYCMRKGKTNYILEHRYIMAQHFGRPLSKEEIVHHLNGIRNDNRIVNLAIVNCHTHPRRTFPKLLQKRIRELEAELSQQKLL